MFELTIVEYEILRSQSGTLKRDKYLESSLMVITEQGVVKLSSGLNSKRAISVNIRIIRLFTKMRKLSLTHKDLVLKVEKLEQELRGQGKEIQVIQYQTVIKND